MIAALRRLPKLETTVVLLAVVALSAIDVAKQSAQQAVNVDTYSSYDAASGGYRAWYEVLQREGVRLERFERPLGFLDSRIDTLVWAEPSPGAASAGGASQGEIGALEAWVKAGGNLVYLGFDDAAAKGGTLKLPETTGETRRVVTYTLARQLGDAGVTRVGWSADARRYKSKRGALILAADRSGALALRYSYGKGRITAVVDETPLRNANLTAPDNARFAYFLTQPARADGLVAFDEAAHGHLIPEHWWEIVPRPFSIGVICAALALLLAFAGASIRLGPPIVPPRQRDPTSIEFVDSVAGLLERGGGSRQAVTDAVRSTKRAIARALGLADDVPNDVLAARIDSPALRADFLALTAFERPQAPADDVLLRAAVLAQRLRKEFTTHAGSRR